jgi:hypothetical protein
MCQTKTEKTKNTHSKFRYVFFENRAVCEVIWKNIVRLDRPPKAIRYMCFACWIPKAKNIHSEYVILIAFTLQQWLHESAWVLTLLYVASSVPIRLNAKVFQ